MRARVYSNGGNSTGGFTFNGGQLTGALILAGNPSEPLEAASKQYVDSSLVNLNASNLATGTLPSARLPSFAGDIVKPAGSSTINLAPIGITAGDYVKPTVDAKGRVTGGSVLTAVDITNVSWDKITTGKPTTLAGYGINDGISLSGGTLTGFLTFNGSISNDMQAVTKQYVDVTLSSSSGIAVGDIIRKPYSTTPTGFLKCNGAEVDKTTYSSLYAVIGDRFSKQKHFTSGRPWEQQYNINETQKNDISNWTSSGTLPVAMSNLTNLIVTKNRVYLIGGWSGTAVLSSVYTAPINADGTLGSWVAATAFPIPVITSCVFVIKNKVYVCGGYKQADGTGTDTVNTVYTANINADGTLGSWVLHNTMPGVVYAASFVLTSSRVYIISGALTNLTGSQSNKIYSAPISSDGTIGAWVTEANAPFYKQVPFTIVTKNRVYICGGSTSLYVDPFTTSVYTAAINSDGTLGTWTLSTSLPLAVRSGSVYVTKNRVYLFGGAINTATTTSVVLTAPINADGTLGTWGTGTPLPTTVGSANLFSTKNRLYLVGGFNGGSVLNTIYTAIIDGGLNDYSAYYAEDSVNYLMPGSGRPWEQQYQINSTQSDNISGWVTTGTLPTNIYTSSAIVTKNRIYLLGGSNGSTTLSTVYTAPINTDGTIGSWVVGNNLPGVFSNSQAIVTKNRVYLLGGYNGAASSIIYTAPINSDGTLGAWSTSTSLPGALWQSHAFITKNRVYLVTGYATSAVYTAPINADGTLGTWMTGTAFPSALHGCSVIVTKNRVYICGGATVTTAGSTIYTATINSDGLIGTWSSAGNLPGNIYNAYTLVTKNRVYIISGSATNSSTVSSTVYTTQINEDGTLGIWITGPTLNWALCAGSCVLTNNRIYVLGGYNGSAAVNTIIMASILGGGNDYSPYYDGSITPAVIVDQSTTFVLPDLTNSEKFDTVSYIKY